MNEELLKYIEALRRLANSARYVQFRLSDGSLTSPMSIEDAATYLYSGNKPLTKTLPSEQVTEHQDRQWAAREAEKLADLAKTRANEYNTRTFYRDVALPTLTLGLSKFVPGLEGLSNEDGMKYAAAGVASRNPALSRLFWPAATAAAAWSWYANTHRPDFRLRTESPEWDYDAGYDVPRPTDYTPPSTATNLGTSATDQSADPEMEQILENFNRAMDLEEEFTPDRPLQEPELNNEENPRQEPEQKPELKPKEPKKPSKFKEEAKKVGKNIAKGYGKAAKGAAYGVGFVGVPAGIGYGIYKATQPGPTEADKALSSLIKLLEEILKVLLVSRNQERIDSMLKLLKDQGSINTKAEPEPLPSGFRPIVGYNEKDPNLVVTYSQSGQPDSVITLLPVPDISRFKKK